MIGTIVQT